MTFNIKETKDANQINLVLKHPVIYDSITDDNSPCREHFEAPISDEYRYIAGYVNGEIIGLLVYHQYRDGEECHVQVLPQHRKEHAKQFGEQSLSFRDRTRPLYAEIPDYYKNVLAFAKLNGFEVIESVDLGYVKGGKSYPVSILRYRC